MPYRISAALLFASLTMLLVFCKSGSHRSTDTQTLTPEPIMPTSKTIIPPDDYADAWRRIDSLEREGLFQSALSDVDALLIRARIDKNESHTIKALLYKGKYITQLEEEGFVKAVNLLEAELPVAPPAEKAVLHSLLGELYATYLENQAWQLQNRTPVPDGEGGDLLTWSAAQIESRSMEHYLASIQPVDALRKVPVDQFQAITTEGKFDNTPSPLRPTLYDLLAHRALDHFANERNYLTEPAYAFVLDDAKAFAPVKDFIGADFNTQDTTSRKWKALKIHQEILKIHLQDTNPAASIDADLKRLAFAYNTYAGQDKTVLYRQALEYLHKQHYENPANPEIVLALAQQIRSQDEKKFPNKENEALSLLEDAIRRHPDAYGTSYCNAVADEIKRPFLNLRLEAVNLPGEGALALVSFKNIQETWISVYRLDQTVQNIYEPFNPEELARWAQTQKPIQQRQWKWAASQDYLLHRTELMLEPLPTGRYLVVASGAQNLQIDQLVSLAATDYSALLPVSFSDSRASTLMVTDRFSGKPLPGVSVDFFQQEWDRNTNTYNTILVKTDKTDQNGVCNPNLERQNNLLTRYRYGKDTLWQGSYYNYRLGGREQPESLEAHFFTDRALYRPGQTVYFKAVFLRRDKDGLPRIEPNRKAKALFYDANRQQKGELEVRSNEYGTINGAFAAPASGLAGQMFIQIEGFQGQANFNVEEYKRPKFEVTFEPTKDAIRLGDKLVFQGKAKAYAGSSIDGAAVRYRVTRQVQFPYWRWYWGGYPPNMGQEMEISNGLVRTSADGSFEIPFEAIPDRSISAGQKPVFTYSVSADVTDINGETRSGNSSVTVGYVALNAALELTDSAPEDSLRNVRIAANNWAGQPQNATGTVTLQKLAEPKMFFKNRLWDNPALKTIDEAVFKNAFPDYAWDGEDNVNNWKNEGTAQNTNFNTAEKSSIDLSALAPKPGYYRITLLTKDAYGIDVEWSKVVQIWDSKRPGDRFRTPNGAVETPSAQPGETGRVLLGSRVPELYWYFAPQRDGRLDKPEWYKVNGSREINIPVAEKDRGGIPLFGYTVYRNRFYPLQYQQVAVPWSNKQLQITYETFRDKLKPGQQEVWRLHISGPQKEKVASEMVASLYDASLDQFLPHQWSPIDFPGHYHSVVPQAQINTAEGAPIQLPYKQVDLPRRQYRALNWFDFPLYGRRMAMHKMERMMQSASMSPGQYGALMESNVAKDELGQPVVLYDMEGAEGAVAASQKQGISPAAEGQVRKNLNETVFFFPNLKTDAEGNIVIEFTMNEALTRWKFLAFAHTKELQQALSTKEIVTQKELMILANPPRFLRQGDRLEFAAKVSNLSAQSLAGTARLELLDALSLAPLDAAFGLKTPQAAFTAPAGQSAPLSWSVQIPEDFTGAVTWRLTAQSGAFTDGEESVLPVVSNHQLVTETLPIALRGGQSGTFSFESLKNSKSTTLRHHRYSIEFSSNPVWYAVQSLSYLMEYPFDCNEQVFSRFYANALASNVTGRMPNLRRMYDRWKMEPGQSNLQSNLSKNQELKTALLEETPWVLDAQSEAQQKQNIALLFDLNRMADEQATAVRTLQERQMPEGGWSWFSGGPPNWYITQHILAGFGHLEHLNAWNAQQNPGTGDMLNNALAYCTREAEREYKTLEKAVASGTTKLENDHLHGLLIHYLYARSFFQPKSDNDPVHAYYLNQAARYWLQKGLYEQGMLALVLHRAGRQTEAQRIVQSLRERAIQNPELGMYWPFDRGFYWYQMPIETQALLIEVFHEVAADARSVEEMRIWLLKNKQTNRWESTKATAEAVYALLLGTGTPNTWLDNTKQVHVTLGGKAIKTDEYEAGTGYFKESWSGNEIKNSWSTIQVDNPNANIVWGAAYWQYFEDMDKITDFRQTPLTIVKQLYREENSATGPVLKPVTDGQGIQPGDKLKVRIEIRVDRAMEFVHLKDSRAAGLEPLNVLSGYRYQGGLGYYESTRDLATHFFIDYLPKGTFVLEYPLVASSKGDFSNGSASLQCMYAPEFSSHSKGMRVKVE